MADTEMQGGRVNWCVVDEIGQGRPDDGLAKLGRVLAEDATRAGAALGAWLERQGSVIAAALSSLPPGMAPATQASNVVAALLAAASTRPPAGGPRAELDQLAAEFPRPIDGLGTQVAAWIVEQDRQHPGLADAVATHLAILEDAEALKQEQAAEDAKGMPRAARLVSRPGRRATPGSAGGGAR